MKSSQNKTHKASKKLRPAVSKGKKHATDPHPLLYLQQTAGNHAIGRMIQAKLQVNQPGDKYEQEADRAAEQVMRMSKPISLVNGQNDVGLETGQSESVTEKKQNQLAHELRPLAQRQTMGPLIQKKGDGGSSNWAEIVRKAKAAFKTKDIEIAGKLYRDAIVMAASGSTFPAGLAKIEPKAEDVRVDFKLAALAETRGKEIPANENNYWRWIYFGSDSLIETQAHTEGVITHELVHVRQYQKLWELYKKNTSPEKGTWEDFQKPYSLRARVEGPEELEAEITSLDFLARLNRSEQELALRGVFVAYVSTSSYTPAKGEPLAMTTATAGPKILDFYKTAGTTLQARMGDAIWWALMKVTPPKDIWRQVLREMKPIAIKGYSDKTFKPIYDEFLKDNDLKFSEIIGDDKKEQPLQRRSTDHIQLSAVPPIVSNVLDSPGRPLDPATRSYMEPRFGCNFDKIRVHTGTEAANSARAVNALAYTVGRDVVFGAGQYAPNTVEGRRLLAHELAHVVQQGQGINQKPSSIPMNRFTADSSLPLIQRKENEEKATAKAKIDYAKAKKGNKENATKLGWDTRLAEFKPSWATLWLSDNFDAFADAVAAFQVELGLKGKAVDGVLGPFTWDRIRPIGEVIVKQKVSWPESTKVCTIAAEERLKKGYAIATGEKLVPKEEKETFRIILQSIGSRMLEVDEQYRGTGAAGALVYLGKGEFVSPSDIWDKKALKPGAAMQVWKKKSALENLKKGKDEDSMGTAFVFVEYVGDDAMKVRHFDELESHKKSEFEVWIGANLLSRNPQEKAP